jgi:tRNA-Thr(GGU) m(6)t(6)A37 methyltransferase TsaA
MHSPIKIKPIGIVRNTAGEEPYDGWKNVVSHIIIDTEYKEALCRLEDFSHIYVLFYLNQMHEKFQSLTNPTGNTEFPLVGAFATRTPNRPSKIGLTICELLGVDYNVIEVKGLDAFDNTPVLDIKPYFPIKVEKVNVPDWIIKINESRTKKEREIVS